MKREFEVEEISDLENISRQISNLIDECGCEIVLMRGAMGAGKTTFIKYLCDVRGVEDVVASPTFALINEYKDARGDDIFHFDFYRVDSINEVLDMGYEEYFFSGSLCLVEWPEKIEELIPYDDAVVATIKIARVEGKNNRIIEFSCDL